MPEDEEEGVGRVREPEGKEVLGIVLRKEGGGKYRVKRAVWVKRDSVVLVEPWKVQGDEKGDIVQSYSQAETDWLEDHNHLNEISEFL